MVNNKALIFKNTLAHAFAWLSAILIMGAFMLLIADIVWHGTQQLSWAFLTQAPSNAGREGGIGPIIVSTLLILGICIATVLPLGLSAAIYLAEFTDDSKFHNRLIRRTLDILASVPSIVIGLFGNAFFSVTLGLGFSILAGGLTLACMVLPIFIRTAEDGIRAIPQSYRQNAISLGLSKLTTLKHIILPMAIPTISIALVLGVGRALAETAALIFTSGYVDRMPESIMDSGRALSIHIYDLAMNVPGGNNNAYASALILLLLLLSINLFTHAINRYYIKSKYQS